MNSLKLTTWRINIDTGSVILLPNKAMSNSLEECRKDMNLLEENLTKDLGAVAFVMLQMAMLLVFRILDKLEDNPRFRCTCNTESKENLCPKCGKSSTPKGFPLNPLISWGFLFGYFCGFDQMPLGWCFALPVMIAFRYWHMSMPYALQNAVELLEVAERNKLAQPTDPETRQVYLELLDNYHIHKANSFKNPRPQRSFIPSLISWDRSGTSWVVLSLVISTFTPVVPLFVIAVVLCDIEAMDSVFGIWLACTVESSICQFFTRKPNTELSSLKLEELDKLLNLVEKEKQKVLSKMILEDEKQTSQVKSDQ